MKKFNFDEIFRSDRQRLLSPLLTPDNYNSRWVFNFVVMCGWTALPLVIFMFAYSYFVLEIHYFPWWAFLIIAGVVSIPFLMDDAEWDASEEIHNLRESEPELYAEIDNDLNLLLEVQP